MPAEQPLRGGATRIGAPGAVARGPAREEFRFVGAAAGAVVFGRPELGAITTLGGVVGVTTRGPVVPAGNVFGALLVAFGGSTATRGPAVTGRDAAGATGFTVGALFGAAGASGGSA